MTWCRVLCVAPWTAAICSICSSWLWLVLGAVDQLTLISQGHDLCCDQCHDEIVVIIILSSQKTKCFLLEWLGRCITVMTRCRSCHVKVMLECHFDQRDGPIPQTTTGADQWLGGDG
jgi:hypothetical protein